MIDKNPFVLSASGIAALLLSLAPFIPPSDNATLVIGGFMLAFAFLFRQWTWKHSVPHPDEHWFAHIPEKQGVFFGDLVAADDYFVGEAGTAEKKNLFFNPSNLKNIVTLFGFVSAVIFLIARNQGVIFSNPALILFGVYGLVIIWTGRSRGLHSVLFLSVFINFCFWIGSGMVRPVFEGFWIFVLIISFYAQKILVYDAFMRDFYKSAVGTPFVKSRAFWLRATGATIMYTLGLIAMYQGLESLYQHLPKESPKHTVASSGASKPDTNGVVKTAAKFLAELQRNGANSSMSRLGGRAIREPGGAEIGGLPQAGSAEIGALPQAGGAGTSAVSNFRGVGTSALSQTGGAGAGALPQSGSAEIGGLPQAGGTERHAILREGKEEIDSVPPASGTGADDVSRTVGAELGEIRRADSDGFGATKQIHGTTRGEIPDMSGAEGSVVGSPTGGATQVPVKDSVDSEQLNARKSQAVQKQEDLERQWRMRLEILLSVLKLVALLLGSYLLYRFLLRRSQIRKEIAHQPSAPQLSNETKSKFRNIFRYLYQQKLGATEEVLVTYYGLEKLFEAAHCGRPPSLPTTHYSAELNQSAPRIGGPFLPIASLFCDTFYGGAKPDPGAIADLRKSVQNILRELGIR